MNAFQEALNDLSPEDQQQAFTDLIVYGQACIWRPKDGPARLISPLELQVGTLATTPLVWETKE